jgi:hypothetical protein
MTFNNKYHVTSKSVSQSGFVSTGAFADALTLHHYVCRQANNIPIAINNETPKGEFRYANFSYSASRAGLVRCTFGRNC